MKRFIKLSIVAIALFSFAVSANAQADQTTIDAPKVNKGWMQYGLNARAGFVNPFTSEKAIALSGGYRFNKKNYLGLNLGFAAAECYDDAHASDHLYAAIPVYLDYTHNFYLGKAKKHSIFLGAEAGIGFSNKVVKYDDGDEVELGYNILFVKSGLDFQLRDRLHLNFSFRLGFLAFGAGVGINF